MKNRTEEHFILSPVSLYLRPTPHPTETKQQRLNRRSELNRTVWFSRGEVSRDTPEDWREEILCGPIS
ncbi:hypothetical protein K1719_014145 [Acacia pycnantha]|nr:hypothetical protein K1719_014145 [Acacia pycnantha]